MDSRDVVSHYRDQALQNGDAASSTMPDEVVREKEDRAILAFVERFAGKPGYLRLLEIGCGNGRMLSLLDERFKGAFELAGFDLTPEMVEIASRRNPGCKVFQGSVLATGLPDAAFDIAISQRVVINVQDEEQQVLAYRELARILRPGAVAVLIEGFKSGLANLNRARQEFLLEPIPEPEVNNWYTGERWQRFLAEGFAELDSAITSGLAPRNFLSSHYFMTRFLHDVIRPASAKLRNTEFAKFFAEVLPPAGNYSPLQIHYLKRS